MLFIQISLLFIYFTFIFVALQNYGFSRDELMPFSLLFFFSPRQVWRRRHPTMSHLDTPALNADGSLKDASEMEWMHSPSANNPPTLSNPKKRIHPDPAVDLEAPVRRPAGKRVKRVSERGKAVADELDSHQRYFFSKNFVGKFRFSFD